MGMTVQAHVARGKHTVWGGSPAGEMLEWYRKEFGRRIARQISHADGSELSAGTDLGQESSTGDRAAWANLMAGAVQSPPGARGVMFLPHMSAAGCPIVDQKSSGAFVGLSNLATSGDMLRAMIEGLDYQFLDIVTAMESGLGTRLDKFVAVGGAVRNQFWMQNKADVAGRPIEVPDVAEATPLGAAILAGMGTGLYRDEEHAFQRVYRPGKTYHPDPELSARYGQWFQVYRQLYPALKPISHQLF
jgi:xylulokinase